MDIFMKREEKVNSDGNGVRESRRRGLFTGLGGRQVGLIAGLDSQLIDAQSGGLAVSAGVGVGADGGKWRKKWSSKEHLID